MKTLSPPTTITVHVPMTFTIHGGRKTIISDVLEQSDEGHHQAVEGQRISLKLSRGTALQRTDIALLKGIARAHRWRQKIESGEYASITELAKAENINESYACRVLRLTLLAPQIVAEILNRRYSSDLMLKRVMKRLPVPWDEQIAALIGRKQAP